MQLSFGKTTVRQFHLERQICMHLCDWTRSFFGVLSGFEIVYNCVVSPQRCSLVQMHEREEVTPSTNSRKSRYKTSFRFSTMKELKQERARREQEEGSRHQCKKDIDIPRGESRNGQHCRQYDRGWDI
jgi:hypothetical protein